MAKTDDTRKRAREAAEQIIGIAGRHARKVILFAMLVERQAALYDALQACRAVVGMKSPEAAEQAIRGLLSGIQSEIKAAHNWKIERENVTRIGELETLVRIALADADPHSAWASKLRDVLENRS